MLAEEIKVQVQKALKELDFPEVPIVIEHPSSAEHGDYSSNVALQLFAKSEARSTKHEKTSQLAKYKTPREIAKAIADYFGFRISDFGFLHKVELAGPGFINFWLSEQFLSDTLKQAIHLGDRYGQNEALKGKKIMVEFTDPNPFKEFHIGHLYSNAVGESLSRLLDASGAQVKRANYQGDVGLHVAKALYGLLAKLKVKSEKLKVNEEKLKELEKKQLAERIRILGEAYAVGAKAYEADEKAKAQIEELNRKIYAQEPDVMEIYGKGRAWSLEYFETIYRRLGTKFDFYYFESEAGKIGLEVVKGGLRKGVFEESQGAIVFSGEKHGLHTRVFVNSQGLPTYEAKDLGLAPTKYKDFPYDKSIIITGNEVDAYFRVVLKALALLSPELGEKTQHLSHGMVRLPTGKMSSRTGEVLTGEWLIDEAKKRILRIMEQGPSFATATSRRLPVRPFRESVALEGDKRDGEIVSRLSKDEVAEMVGIGAVKYALLRGSIGRDIIFDIDESVNLEGNSGPYLQYTFARCKSVLAKSEARSTKHEAVSNFDIRASNLNAEDLSILRWLYRYPEVVEQAVKGYAPYLVCAYLYGLAQRYNAFYNKHRIVQTKKEEERRFRLMMTSAIAQILENGLKLLGIAAPETM
ncbi:MAG: arginine--tRNA ligase [Candidatus Chisholmbacteria bacterium RIFCSPLOWO2_01_FULL_50_28]|uniref:Arginine--tRNA ligase n=1 Tax=Candidatus Chisholmbacteria bacterium RIFCSPHIGHO2_01_FULL_52_32 TaxID=1797591 RepID=A0A1G1VRS9_9BACT|nr:MAG: arginine--tRNA ligase [Candidatus Chisholmbacteria bacterium RIFCSPHIGHO2_01_FULL_52_32]OGY20519.1 MAG: arginine--tRNA ligase [Candidatus Chisholmbacteria bacterium RIFCSPLOWO2_01_FULL_50_28]